MELLAVIFAEEKEHILPEVIAVLDPQSIRGGDGEEVKELNHVWGPASPSALDYLLGIAHQREDRLDVYVARSDGFLDQSLAELLVQVIPVGVEETHWRNELGNLLLFREVAEEAVESLPEDHDLLDGPPELAEEGLDNCCC